MRDVRDEGIGLWGKFGTGDRGIGEGRKREIGV